MTEDNMNKKKKLFEPIRRGAPSLPFDFAEALKKIEAEKEEIENISKQKLYERNNE